MFIVESKAAEDLDSLAKHKLLYPLLAIRDKVPHYMPVVPVYLRVVQGKDGYHFYFAECALAESVESDVPVLSDPRAVSSKHYVLRLFRGL